MAAGDPEPYSPLTDAAARSLLDEQFGLTAIRLRRLPTEQDDTFRADTVTGSVILKATGPHGAVSEQRAQITLLQHLAATDPDLPVPRVIPSRSGDPLVEHPDDTGGRRLVRAMSYLRGSMLSDEPDATAPWFAVGAVAARLDEALASLASEPFERVLLWDLQRFADLQGLIGTLGDSESEPVVAAIIRDFAADVAPRLASLPRQVIHNDFNRDNVLVDPARPGTVAGVLDFGDAVTSARVIEVAVAMAYAVPIGPGDPWHAPSQVLTGYQSVARLSAEELAVLPRLVIARHAQRLLLNARLVATLPQSADYTGRYLITTWQQLQALLAAPAPRFEA
jgi:Ser/Thr protein kinase RdoA (MazF antagonist)